MKMKRTSGRTPGTPEGRCMRRRSKRSRRSRGTSVKLLCAAVLACSAFTGAAAEEEKESQIGARVFKNKNGDTMPCRIFKPAGYNRKSRYPLVLCFHGAGGRCTDSKSRGTQAFVALSSPEVQKEYPAFLLTPQCPGDKVWVTTFYSLSKDKPSEPMGLVVDILQSVCAEFRVDPTRVYVTGQSMGGYGTWDIIVRYPKTFAAAIPVCGGGDFHQAKRIAHLPIWAFHGDKDTVVLPRASRRMVEALKKAGSKNVEYTEYPGVAHASWVPAWKEKELIPWLFKQRNRFAARGGRMSWRWGYYRFQPVFDVGFRVVRSSDAAAGRKVAKEEWTNEIDRKISEERRLVT